LRAAQRYMHVPLHAFKPQTVRQRRACFVTAFSISAMLSCSPNLTFPSLLEHAFSNTETSCALEIQLLVKSTLILSIGCDGNNRNTKSKSASVNGRHPHHPIAPSARAWQERPRANQDQSDAMSVIADWIGRSIH